MFIAALNEEDPRLVAAAFTSISVTEIFAPSPRAFNPCRSFNASVTSISEVT